MTPQESTDSSQHMLVESNQTRDFQRTGVGVHSRLNLHMRKSLLIIDQEQE